MSDLLKKKDKGFTLIEIVLVLAIAGLIMVIVFLAVSGAQRSRRDTQRKNDVSRIASQLEQYASNNNGAYPTTAAQLTGAGGFNLTYLTPATSWQDPSTGATYTPAYAVTAAVLGMGVVNYHDGEICSNGVMTAVGASARNYAVVMGLEQGANVCRDNH